MSDTLRIQFPEKLRYRKRFVQTTGKTVFLNLLPFHVATGCNGYHRNGLSLRKVRRPQQFQQVEAVYGRHLYIGKQYIEGIETQGIQQFIQLHARHRSDTAMLEHGRGERKLNTVIINQKYAKRAL